MDYDFIYQQPCIERETVQGISSISLETNAFSHRKVFLFGEVNEQMLDSLTKQMLYMNAEAEKPIRIYINSPGGSVIYGLAIYDQIQSCPCTINMFRVGMASSMGAIILAGGQRGRRYILPHSKVMIHEPLIDGGVGGSASTIKSTAESILKTKRLINGILAKHTGKTIEEIDKATDHDNFMTAKEAVEFGICDRIVERIA